MSRPDLPRAIAALFCGAAPINPASQNVSFLEIMAGVGVRKLPAELPPFLFVTVLVGGQPGRVYTPHLRFLDPAGKAIAEQSGVDIPFTTQIKRVNYTHQVNQMAGSSDIVQRAGVYKMEMLIDKERVAIADLEIIKVDLPLTEGKG